MTSRENLGMTLFFSRQFTNCNLCHQLRQSQVDAQEIFSNYQYHNIGVPPNDALRAINGKGREFVDCGRWITRRCKRQVKRAGSASRCATSPSPGRDHNGVFKDLRTVILFITNTTVAVPVGRSTRKPGRTGRALEVSE